jgi:hypothetical protein
MKVVSPAQSRSQVTGRRQDFSYKFHANFLQNNMPFHLKNFRLAFTIAAITALTQIVGCASIVSGTNQSVSVETRNETGSVSGASCKLSNNKGTWFITSPGSTMVQRSFEDMSVRCDKGSEEPGIASAKSSTKAMAFGNVIFGGPIGVGVDIATGAAYDYPELITVFMGKTVTATPAVKNNEPAKPVPAVSAPAEPAKPAVATKL